MSVSLEGSYELGEVGEGGRHAPEVGQVPHRLPIPQNPFAPKDGLNTQTGPESRQNLLHSRPKPFKKASTILRRSDVDIKLKVNATITAGNPPAHEYCK
jgi:hypothetical protein